MRCASCGRDDPFEEQMRTCAMCSQRVCGRDECLSASGGGLCSKCLNS